MPPDWASSRMPVQRRRWRTERSVRLLCPPVERSTELSRSERADRPTPARPIARLRGGVLPHAPTSRRGEQEQRGPGRAGPGRAGPGGVQACLERRRRGCGLRTAATSHNQKDRARRHSIRVATVFCRRLGRLCGEVERRLRQQDDACIAVVPQEHRRLILRRGLRRAHVDDRDLRRATC
jgi:hypothetical protein